MSAFKMSLKSFKELGTVLEESRVSRSIKEQIAAKTDDEVFNEAMSNVREIREFRELSLSKPREKKILAGRRDDTLEILRQIRDGERQITLADTGEYIEWMGPRVRKDLAQRLHQGNFSVQDSIDLHGMTLGEAEESLHAFLREALKKRLFCVKVIHGRGLRSPGGPVLKNAVQQWLRGVFRKQVLAYSSAKNSDGGLGATYILLR